jgi:hypothetical protein
MQIKFEIDKTSLNNIFTNLKSIESIVDYDLKDNLNKKSYELRNKAREILEGKILPDGESTGNLSASIDVAEVSPTNFEIGPDMDKAFYANWIETGHFLVNKKWWEGYHYMEGAWNENSPDMVNHIATAIKNNLQKL